MAETQEVKVVITGEDRSGSAWSSLGKAAGIATAAFAAIGGAAVIAGKKAYDAAREAVAGEKQLEAVLKSTANAAGLFKEDILDQAAALSRMTNFTDDAVLSSQNLLLTFTQIKGPVFQQATSTILDMSAALGQDLKSSAIQVGKALNDPINGITALSRVGVSFNDEQKKLITTLVETGKTAEAQGIILKELAVEFGGSAAAVADPFVQMKNAIDELWETIGRALKPQLDALAATFTDFVVTHGPAIAEAFRVVIQVLLDLFGSIGRVQESFTSFVNWIEENTGLITILKTAFENIWLVFTVNLLPALKDLWEAFQPLMPFVTTFAKVLGVLLLGSIIAVVKIIEVSLIVAIQTITKVVEIATAGIEFFKKQWEQTIDIISKVINYIDSLIEKIKSLNVVQGASNAIKGALGFGGARADGGPVSTGKAYLVGERGPELFVPQSMGNIVPNGRGGGIVVNVYGAQFLDQYAAEKFGDMLADRLKSGLRV